MDNFEEELTEQEIQELKEIVPKNLLTKEQFEVFKTFDYWPEAVNYLRTIVDGNKFAKIYWDLYKDEEYEE